jgi:hypothetical protein
VPTVPKCAWDCWLAEGLVAGRDGRIDPEEAGKIDVAIGFNRQAFERDCTHRALRHVSDDHTGIQCGIRCSLRIGEIVRTAEFAGLVDID